ncbi:MAG: hypothetical protein ABJD38_19980 [Aurantimonas coralicida]
MTGDDDGATVGPADMGPVDAHVACLAHGAARRTGDTAVVAAADMAHGLGCMAGADGDAEAQAIGGGRGGGGRDTAGGERGNDTDRAGERLEHRGVSSLGSGGQTRRLDRIGRSPIARPPDSVRRKERSPPRPFGKE